MSSSDNVVLPRHRESPRIRKFRQGIVQAIPKFPNNRQTLQLLEEKSIGSLLIDYTNWAHRLIPPRPRSVVIEPSLTVDARWNSLAVETKALLERVRIGDALNPNLSRDAIRRGFTPLSSQQSTETNRWGDKDFLLNVMGYHHLHLSSEIDKSGFAKRTKEVLFAQITRDKFHAIGFFDHSVFETTASQTMTEERNRLWEIYEYRNSLGLQPGVVYVSNPITTSGHTVQHTHLAICFARIVTALDPKLDDLASRVEIFPNLPVSEIRGMKLEWRFNFLDLCLLDHSAKAFYVMQKGPI